MNWNLISILLLLPSLSRSAPKPHDGIHVKSEDDIIAEIDVKIEQGDNLAGNEVRVPEEQIPEIDDENSSEEDEHFDENKDEKQDPAVDEYKDLDEDEDQSREGKDEDLDEDENPADEDTDLDEDPAKGKEKDLDEDLAKEYKDLDEDKDLSEDQDFEEDEDKGHDAAEDKDEEIHINMEEKNLPEKSNNDNEDHLAKSDAENGDLLGIGIAKDEQHKGINVKVELESLSGIDIQAEAEDNNPSGIDVMTIEKKSDEEDISNIGVAQKDEYLQESGADSSDRLTGIDAITEDKSVTGPPVIKLENNSPSEINAKNKDEQTIVFDPLSKTDQNAKDEVTEIEHFDTHAKTLGKIHLSVETEKEPLSKVEVKSEDENLPELRVTDTDKDLSKNGARSNENHATGMDVMNNDLLSGVDIKAKEELALKNNAKGVVENLPNNEHIIPQDKNLVDIDIKVKEDGQSDIDKMINGVFEENEQNLPSIDLKAQYDNPANIDELKNGVFEENEQNLPNIDLKAQYDNLANIDKMIDGVFEENEQNLANIELIDQDKNLVFIDEMINSVFEEDEQNLANIDLKAQDNNPANIDKMINGVFEENEQNLPNIELIDQDKNLAFIDEMINGVFEENEQNLSNIELNDQDKKLAFIDEMINGVFEEDEQNLPNIDLKAQDKNLAFIDEMINGVFEEEEQNLPNINLKAQYDNPANIDKMINGVSEENEQNLPNIELIDQDKNLALNDEMINVIFEEDLESPDFEIKVQDENLVEIDTMAKDDSGINKMIDNVYEAEDEIGKIQEADTQSPATADSIVTLNDDIKKAEGGELGVLMTRLMGIIGVGESAEINPTKSESKPGEELFSKIDVKTNKQLSQDEIDMVSKIYMSKYEDLDEIKATAEIYQKAGDKHLTKLDEDIAEDGDPNSAEEPAINGKTSELELTKRAGIFVKSLFDMMGLGDSVKSVQSSTCSPSSPLYYADLNDTLCKNFYHCSDGHSPYLQECPNGTRWSPQLHTCDHEANVPCPRTTSADMTVARCEFKGTGGVFGEVIIVQEIGGENAANGSRFQGKIIGLSPGLHGFHVHAKGDLGDDCKAAGGHFNPEGVIHGGKDADVRHVGDLGNLEAGEDGDLVLDLWDQVALLEGDNSIIGKAIVVHQGRDDEGEGGNEGSLLHGNAGPRAGCCLIQKV